MVKAGKMMWKEIVNPNWIRDSISGVISIEWPRLSSFGVVLRDEGSSLRVGTGAFRSLPFRRTADWQPDRIRRRGLVAHRRRLDICRPARRPRLHKQQTF